MFGRISTFTRFSRQKFAYYNVYSKSKCCRRRYSAPAAPPKLVERRNYANLDDDDLKIFEKLVGAEGVLSALSGGHDLTSYNEDWLRQFKGRSKLVLKPKSTEEVEVIVGYCHQKNLALCIQGGNTGLVAGSVPVFDEIVLNMSRMNRIIDFDAHSGILTCEAGCVLQTLDDHVSDHGYVMPFDLGAKGSCQLGGNVSTCAGGIRFLRYGSLHGSVVGLEVISPMQNGVQRLDVMSRVRKDNTGLHLMHLFVGAEGQLGVVTKIRLLCAPKSSSVNVAFVGLARFEYCLEALKLARQHLGEILSSFEFMDKESVECSEENSQISSPLESKHNFYLLIETMGSDEAHDSEKMQSFLDTCLTQKIVENGCIASDINQSKNIWRIRESFTESLVKDGYVYKHDVSLPLDKFYALVENTRDVSHGDARRVIGFGHLGDGNLHLNVTSEEKSPELEQKLYPFVYQWTHKNGGSISAEHGIGLLKRQYLHFMKPEPILQLSSDLKQIFDPKWILNPYKSLPD